MKVWKLVNSDGKRLRSFVIEPSQSPFCRRYKKGCETLPAEGTRLFACRSLLKMRKYFGASLFHMSPALQVWLADASDVKFGTSDLGCDEDEKFLEFWNEHPNGKKDIELGNQYLCGLCKSITLLRPATDKELRAAGFKLPT
jgi:hypothetical protein